MARFDVSFYGTPAGRDPWQETVYDIHRACIFLTCTLPSGDKRALSLDCSADWTASCTATPADKTKAPRQWTRSFKNSSTIKRAINKVFDALEDARQENDGSVYRICTAVFAAAGFCAA